MELAMEPMELAMDVLKTVTMIAKFITEDWWSTVRLPPRSRETRHTLSLPCPPEVSYSWTLPTSAPCLEQCCPPWPWLPCGIGGEIGFFAFRRYIYCIYALGSVQQVLCLCVCVYNRCWLYNWPLVCPTGHGYVQLALCITCRTVYTTRIPSRVTQSLTLRQASPDCTASLILPYQLEMFPT